MVIYFKSEKALDYLLNHGFVYTLRYSARKKLGPDWIQANRNSRKIADVNISYVGRVILDPAVKLDPLNLYTVVMIDPWKDDRIYNIVGTLEDYVAHSGFDSVDEWIEEFRNLSGNKKTAWLYKVEID